MGIIVKPGYEQYCLYDNPFFPAGLTPYRIEVTITGVEPDVHWSPADGAAPNGRHIFYQYDANHWYMNEAPDQGILTIEQTPGQSLVIFQPAMVWCFLSMIINPLQVFFANTNDNLVWKGGYAHLTWREPVGGNNSLQTMCELAGVEATNKTFAEIMVDADNEPLIRISKRADGTCIRVKVEDMRFVDRGDPAAWDFSLGSFTNDNTWRDLSLAAIVPEGVVLVLLRVAVRTTAGLPAFWIRKNGNVNTVNKSGVWVQAVNSLIGFDMLVAVDANRIVEYKGNVATYDTLNLGVGGWWI